MTLLVTLLGLITAVQARSVALLVDFGDKTGWMKDKNPAVLAKAAEAYRALNYEVIFVKPHQDIRSVLTATFKDLGQVDQLAIETRGHGFTDPPPKKFAERYPTLNNGVSASGDDSATSFRFSNGFNGNIVTIPPNTKPRDMEAAVLESRYARDVGVGDFSQWIKDVRQRNPKAIVKITMNQCYSGHAARSFNSIEGIQAYSGASDDLPTHGILGPPIKDFSDEYYGNLAQAGASTSHLDTFERARAKWVSINKLENDEDSEVPWTPVDAFINTWCNDHRTSEPRAAKANPNQLLTTLKKSSDQTLQLETEVADRGDERWRCAGTNRLERTSRMQKSSARLLRQAIDAFGQRVAASSATSQFKQRMQTELDYRTKCLEADEAGACAKDQRILYEFPPNLDEVPNGVVIGTCTRREIEVATKCLNEVGAYATSHPSFAMAQLDLIRMNLQLLTKKCDQKVDRARLGAYKQCYGRFWSDADPETLLKLEALGQLAVKPVRAPSDPRKATGDSKWAQ